MAIKMTASEIKAIEEKLNNPTSEIVCPRCGGKLVLKECAFASEVKCETDNCIRGVVRGI